MKVGLFVPCLAEHFDARPVEATLLVLRHLGLDVDYPRAQTCCGQPFRTTGDLASAAALARRMASVFARYDRVITPSASCAAMVSCHAPALATSSSPPPPHPPLQPLQPLQATPAPLPEAAGRHPVVGAPEGTAHVQRPGRRDAIVALGAKVRELAAFLIEHGFDPSAARWAGTVTYHPSCHGRDLGAPDPVPTLLSRVTGLTLVPLPNASQCCGFGGAFATRFPEVSTALGRDKLAHVEGTAARAVIVNDSGCRLHLRSLAPKLPIVHLAELLAEGLGLMPRRPHLRTVP